MKKIISMAALVCSFFIACKSQQSSGDNDSGEGSKTEKEKKITKRDYSITRANAYNDIFIDSLQMETVITDKKIPDSLSRRIRSFYNARNYQFAWFSSKGLTEQSLGFWNLHNFAVYDGDTSLRNAALQKKMDALISDDGFSVSGNDKSMINTEVLLTEHFIKYSLSNYEKGFIKRKEMERFIPTKKQDIVTLSDSLLNKKHKDNKYFEDVNNAYKLLKAELGKYADIEKNGGWQTLPTDAKQFKKGTSSPTILALKKRLQITGDLNTIADTTLQYSDFLDQGIKNAQKRFGYKPDGIVTATLLKDLNVPVEARLEQIMINMNRMRWMPQEPDGRLILVNIPEFVLHLFDGKTKVFDMNVVVGKEGNNTMMFTGKLSQVVFSPYWNVPPSIVKKELEPSIAKNANYLESHNMERTSDGGIRQKPGSDNSLGKVKFLFPNSFNIYFHDTPSKSLFNKDKRAYSHGCIRLSEPQKMAEYLLKDDPSWTTDKIVGAMNAGTEKYVKVKSPIPVFITYYTAWVDETGLLNFRDDIYGHDKTLTQKMFAAK